MAIPTDKESLQTAIQMHYKKLADELTDIPIDITTVKSLDGHAKNTQMSIHNLLSYLIGWGQLVLKWNDGKLAIDKIEFPETGYKWNELGKLAQKFYTDYNAVSFLELRKLLDQTVTDIHKLIESKTNEELYGHDWYGKWTLGRMIQLNTSSPYQNARKRIRVWKKKEEL